MSGSVSLSILHNNFTYSNHSAALYSHTRCTFTFNVVTNSDALAVGSSTYSA